MGLRGRESLMPRNLLPNLFILCSIYNPRTHICESGPLSFVVIALIALKTPPLTQGLLSDLPASAVTNGDSYHKIIPL